jgi:hypothetical protein
MENRPPIRAGDELIDGLFDLCVDFLMWAADLLGISYNEINIWIFCVLWPLFTVALMVVVVVQWRKIRKLKRQRGQPFG